MNVKAGKWESKIKLYAYNLTGYTIKNLDIVHTYDSVSQALRHPEAISSGNKVGDVELSTGGGMKFDWYTVTFDFVDGAGVVTPRGTDFYCNCGKSEKSVMLVFNATDLDCRYYKKDNPGIGDDPSSKCSGKSYR